MPFVSSLLLVILAILHCTRGAVLADSDQPLLSRTRRVIGGHAVDVVQMPFLVSIRRKGMFECGGTLVTPRCVLTAAHCIREGRAKEFTVRGGATYLNESNSCSGNTTTSNSCRRGVSRIITQRKFNRRTFESDIAIFQLDGELLGRAIETIALAAERPKAGDFVRIAGWGIIHETHTQPSNQMRTAHLQVWRQSDCRRMYADYRNVTMSMFCASIPGQRDACQADSGGPAILNDQLVGIVSWGRGYECGRHESPGVYTSVSNLRVWIDQVLQTHCY